jgi:Na+/H+ antiporter NhaD/arsenite permease-like protein
MTPLVLDVVARRQRDPVPYLLAIAMASNIGSVATITGNPQNIIIGSLSRIPYAAFTAALAPVAAFGLLLTVALIALVYRREFLTGDLLPPARAPAPRYHGPLVVKTVLVAAAIVLMFFLGAPVAKVAIIGGAFLLLTRRVKPEKIYREIDWPLLVMFVGLFVVVGGLEKTVVRPNFETLAGALHFENDALLAGVAAVLSNIVSNVPAVLVLKPFVPNLPDAQHGWLVVAMAATFAGNFTLVGSIANLIVAERAKARGVVLGFRSYFLIGAPLTILTIVAGLLWLGGGSPG